jgi:hypothetical protein
VSIIIHGEALHRRHPSTYPTSVASRQARIRVALFRFPVGWGLDQ